MNLSQLFALLALSMLLLAGSASADDDDDDDDDEGILGFDGEDLGTVALWMLVATVSIVIWKPSYVWLNKNAKDLFEEPKVVKSRLRKVNKVYMRIHYWIGLGVVIIGAAHGLSVGNDGRGVLYWSGWAGLVMMSILGGLMLWKWPPRKVKKRARALHTQRALLVITLVLLFVAHD